MGTQNAPLKCTLIGCGKMGSALLKRWLTSNLNIEFSVLEPGDLPDGLDHSAIKHGRTPEDLDDFLRASDILIMAVKPQVMGDVCGSIKPFTPENALILSIAAGTSIENFESWFSPAQPIVRVMPNTPAAIAKGASVGVANPRVSPEQKDIAAQLLSCTGLFEWTQDEGLLNAVTALSGSGPAYIFHLIEVLTAAGIEIGLPADLAESLARQTVIGSAALAEAESALPASTLRENVTSPGGTTAAALEVLMNGELEEIYKKALAAAKLRGEDLSA